MIRPACALSIVSCAAVLALVGCGGSTKTTSSAAAGTSSGQAAVPSAGGSSTGSSTKTTPGSGSSGGTAPSAPETQPLTSTSKGALPGTSTGSRLPPGTKSKKAKSPTATAVAACEQAIAQKSGLSPAVKATARQICKQTTGSLLAPNSKLEREVCIRVVNSSKQSAEVKAQALARCKRL